MQLTHSSTEISIRHRSRRRHRLGEATGRTAYFLDIDNLCGTGTASPAEVRRMFEAFLETFEIGPSDQVYCAGTAMAAFVAARTCPGFHVVVGKGQDGADRRLLDLADPDFVSLRFERVVIGSGDGIFTELASDLRNRGVEVLLLLGHGCLNRRLGRAVHNVETASGESLVRLCLAA